MKKLCVLVLLAAILMTAAAFAEDFVESPAIRPSKVLATMLLNENGEPYLSEDFEIVIVEKNERVVELGNQLAEYVAAVPVYQIFGEEVFEQAASYIPEGVTPENYQLNEFEAIEQHGYDPSFGGAGAVFEFAEDYPSDAILLAIVYIEPIPEEGEEAAEQTQFDCTALPAFVDNGKVVVVFSQDVLTRMMNENINTVMTILQAR